MPKEIIEIVAGNLDTLDLLADDVEAKKEFEAKWPFTCDLCEGDVEKGGYFVFFGKKDKVCDGCRDGIVKFLRDLRKQAMKKEEPK